MEDQEDNKKTTERSTGDTVNNQRITRSMVRSLPASSRDNLVFENLMHGRPARSAKPKSDTPEDSHKTTDLPSTANAAGDRLKDWQLEFDKVRAKVMKDYENENAARVEADQKTSEVNQAQPIITALMQEIATLRRDTNALLEAQSSPQPPISDEPGMEDLLTIPEAEGPAKTWHPASQPPIRQGRKDVELDPRRIRIRRPARTPVNNRDGQDGYSTESHSSDEDAEMFTGGRYSNRTERFQDLTFFGRRKGPRHGQLSVIKPSDPAFDRLMNYRYYRLYDTTMIRNADDSKKLREQIKTFQAAFEGTKFSAEDPIMVFDFLTRFVEEADTLGVSEAHAFLILPKLLIGRAERHLRSIRNGARSGGVKCWPEVVNHFLRTYATPAAIRNAVNDLRNIRQKPREDEIAYSERINDATHRCGNAFDEVDKMTLFVNGLLPSIQTVVARFRESRNRNELSYEELVHYSQDEGDSHRARLQCFTEIANANGKKGSKNVYCLESNQLERADHHYNEDSCSSDEEVKPSTNHRDQVDNEEPQPLLYARSENKPRPRVEKARHITNQDSNTAKNRPGWIDNRKQIICYQCYEVNSHIMPECTVQLANMRKIVDNYEELSDEQKNIVPNESVTLARQYLSMKSELGSTTHNGENQLRTESKN